MSDAVKAYREKVQNTKVVEIRGVPFKIRRLTPVLAADLITLVGPEGNPEMVMKAVPQALPLVLKTCVVEPKIADKGSEDALGLDELDPMDAMQLFAEIMEFSGMAEAAEVQKFRSEVAAGNGRGKRRGHGRKKTK